MKLLKSFLILFIAISITSCSSDDDNSFELVATNLAGSYNLTAYKSVEAEIATASNGNESTLSTTTKTGSTFSIDVALNANGTYSIGGTLLLKYKADPTPKGGDEDNEILTLASSGNYTLNATAKTITLTVSEDEAFIGGTFDIKSFNEDKMVLKQTVEGTGDVRIDAITDITLERN
ncbi:hypothetical protein [Polaribacter butkevichii]|uniref:Lipocalin-like domain-containing protein n=1 Tax=Polaribacter butkevichii TaxID=218490 RepID=A0A2P6C6X4_9FLAO|nr:hypothetical protein [Polaribacter butkevichii]PQJ68642.1 hypothetical protein BTO14_11315 [Polaribacter butkevichii]